MLTDVITSAVDWWFSGPQTNTKPSLFKKLLHARDFFIWSAKAHEYHVVKKDLCVTTRERGRSW